MNEMPNPDMGAAHAGFSPSAFQDLRPGPADLVRSAQKLWTLS